MRDRFVLFKENAKYNIKIAQNVINARLMYISTDKEGQLYLQV